MKVPSTLKFLLFMALLTAFILWGCNPKIKKNKSFDLNCSAKKTQYEPRFEWTWLKDTRGKKR